MRFKRWYNGQYQKYKALLRELPIKGWEIKMKIL